MSTLHTKNEGSSRVLWKVDASMSNHTDPKEPLEPFNGSLQLKKRVISFFSDNSNVGVGDILFWAVVFSFKWI
jgi:hypothetical protein